MRGRFRPAKPGNGQDSLRRNQNSNNRQNFNGQSNPNQIMRVKREASAFSSERGLINFLRKQLEDLDPKRVYKRLDQYEYVIKFLETSTSEEGFALFFKLYGSKTLLEYNFLEERSAIFLQMFDYGRFKLFDTITQVIRNYIIFGKIDEINDALNFFKNVATVVPQQIPTLRKMFQSIPQHIIQLDSTTVLQQYVDIALRHFNDVEREMINDRKRYEEIYPTSEQINPRSGLVFLPNKYKEGYENANILVNTLLSLELENFVVPIRKGLNSLLRGELDPRDLYLYENVCLMPLISTSIPEATNFLHFDIRVPPNATKNVIIDWPHSERLNENSLLFLSKSPYCQQIDAICLSKAKSNKRFHESKDFVHILNENIVPVQLVKGNIVPCEQYYMFEGTEGFFTHEV